MRRIQAPGKNSLSPEQVVEALRALQERIADVAPLTTNERRIARQQGRLSETVVQKSIHLIGVTDTMTQAVGTEPEVPRKTMSRSTGQV